MNTPLSTETEQSARLSCRVSQGQRILIMPAHE